MFGRKAINLLGMISWALRRREDGAARVATPTRHLAPPVTLMDLLNEQPGLLGSLKRIGDLLLWVSTPQRLTRGARFGEDDLDTDDLDADGLDDQVGPPFARRSDARVAP
jgi:hypothetical protein